MTQELKSYTPTWRERLVGLLGGSNDPMLAGLLGGNDTIPIGLLDLLPGVGSAIGAQEGYQSGGLQGAAIGLLPASRPGRMLMRAARRVPRAVETRSAKELAKLDAENAAISASRSNVPQRPAGAAPDRTPYSLVRFRAPQGDSARFKTLEAKINADPHTADTLLNFAREGEEIGRKWYSTEKLRSRFIDELGEKKGDMAWREYMWLVGATSTGSKVIPNIRNASHYFVQGQERLANIADKLLAMEAIPAKGSGYGHKMQRNHAKNVGNVVTGGWGPDADPRLNPKPRGFLQSLMGSETNIAADKHFMRLMGMISDDPQFLHSSAEISQELVDKLRAERGDAFVRKYVKYARKDDGKTLRINFGAKRAVKDHPDLYESIKKEAQIWDDTPSDNEYAAFERVTSKLAKQLDMTPAQFQASLWMGAAKHTDVDPSSLDTFENLFDRVVRDRAAERGRTEQDVWKRFVHRKEALALPLGLLGGGTLLQGGLLNQQD